MSADEDGPVGTREVAHRVFAAEFDDADLSHRDSEEERAPSYVITPSGAKANRLFLAGVLTEVEDVNEDMLRARIVDPTGAFVVYAGQYQPDARTFFERTEPPQFVAVSGKARTFTPEDGDRVFTSVRPESVNAVDADTRDRWVVDTARRTLDRVAAMATAIDAGADEDPAAAGLDPSAGVALALDHYGTTPGYLDALAELALDAARVVAGEREEVRPLSADPSDPSSADLAALKSLGTVEVDRVTEAEGDAGGGEAATTSADASEESETAGTGEPAGTADAADGASTAGTGDTGTADATTGGSAGSEDGASEGAATDDAEGSAETAAVEASSGGGDDELGDFEPGGLSTGEDEGPESADAAGTDAGADPDVGDEMYELDEDERQEIEQEYGTEFSTGTEVDAPGEADIETPDPEDLAEEAGDGGAGEPETEVEEEEPGSGKPDPETRGEGSGTEADDEDEEPAAGADEEEESGSAEDVDLDDLVIDLMRDLDDGDGADREELIAAAVDESGADPGDVEDAIQDALMGGQCYEPDDGKLKPI